MFPHNSQHSQRRLVFLPVTFRFSLKFSISNGSINNNRIDPSWLTMEMVLATGPIFVVTKMPLFVDVKTAPLIRAETALS